MMLSSDDKQRIEYRFAKFCKVVLRNAACTYFRDWNRKSKQEISVEYLYEQKHFELCYMDEYLIEQGTPTDFIVHGQTVTVDNECLAKALLCLSEKQLKIILMRYYLQLTDTKIAKILNRPRTTVNYQKSVALKKLRERLEKTNDET